MYSLDAVITFLHIIETSCECVDAKIVQLPSRTSTLNLNQRRASQSDLLIDKEIGG
jgi:hypothetical protein